MYFQNLWSRGWMPEYSDYGDKQDVVTGDWLWMNVFLYISSVQPQLHSYTFISIRSPKSPQILLLCRSDKWWHTCGGDKVAATWFFTHTYGLEQYSTFAALWVIDVKPAARQTRPRTRTVVLGNLWRFFTMRRSILTRTSFINLSNCATFPFGYAAGVV